MDHTGEAGQHCPGGAPIVFPDTTVGEADFNYGEGSPEIFLRFFTSLT
jgi:hypothetical protein